ncbi:MAG: peptide chain release factor N(5)-glutamine methyltransferase [Patescibacteria group bacterium]
MTVQEALLQATQKLRASTSAALDAELLIAFVLRASKEFLFTHPEHKLNPAQQIKFARLLRRRQKREPIAYILGHKEFFGLDFFVNKNVLIPRPETELLVAEVVQLMSGKKQPKIVDIGVGSGAVAVALKHLFPRAKVYATDSSRRALHVAKKNARAHKTSINFKSGSLLSPFSKVRFDCIVSNPPYLTAQEMKHPDLQFEPKAALYGGRAGLEIYQRLLVQAASQLGPKGYLVLEIGHNQAKPLGRLAKKLWPKARLQVKKDLAGFNRVMIIQPF